MTRASASELRRARLRAQLLSGSEASNVTDATSRLLAVQAQDLGSAYWALGVRTPGARRADVSAALDSGALVRSWPLRGTLQLVAAEDLRWLLGLTAQRQLRTAERTRAQLGLDATVVDRARAAATEALSGGGRLDRAGMMAVFTAAGLDVSAGRGYQLIVQLAQTGTLVWGPVVRTQQALVLLDEWVPPAAPLDQDEALARLVDRYLSGHGPATAADIAWWSGLPVTRIRRGAQAARVPVADTDAGEVYLPDEPAPPAVPRGALLLPGFDEYLLGYQNRDLVLDPRHFGHIVPVRNGAFRPIVVKAGRVVAVWRAERSAAGAGVTITPFDEASALAPADLAPALRRYGDFHGVRAWVP